MFHKGIDKIYFIRDSDNIFCCLLGMEFFPPLFIIKINRGMLLLYSYWRSSCSWRVRIALHLKGIPFEIKPINLLKGEQSSNEYLKINPSGAVPCLIASEEAIPISQSIGIVEYLEEKFPQTKGILLKRLSF